MLGDMDLLEQVAQQNAVWVLVSFFTSCSDCFGFHVAYNIH
jgi:hypothetical protein